MKKLSKVFLSVITLGAVACSSGAFAACGGNTPAEHTHNWGDWTEKAAANCTAAKVEERNCLYESCPGNGHEERSVGEPLGHAFGDWDFTPPSLEAAGGADKTCTRDGCTGTLHVDLPKLGGEGYVKGEDSATCAGGGMQKYTFKHSEGDIVFNVATPAKAHTFGNWTVLSAPTDKDTGFARAVCSGDGCKQTKLEMLPVLTDESIESGFLPNAESKLRAQQGENGFTPLQSRLRMKSSAAFSLKRIWLICPCLFTATTLWNLPLMKIRFANSFPKRSRRIP